MGCCESRRQTLHPNSGPKLCRSQADFKVSIYRRQVLTAIEVAEAEHGQPVTYLQIFRVYESLTHYRIPLVFPAFVLLALSDLYMDD